MSAPECPIVQQALDHRKRLHFQSLRPQKDLPVVRFAPDVISNFESSTLDNRLLSTERKSILHHSADNAAVP